jgi:hypothetical protein
MPERQPPHGRQLEGELMLAVQPRLPLAVPLRPRARGIRRPFHPVQGEGPYRLPNAVRDRLAAALTPYRNRDAAYTLAVFIARFWSTPSRITDSFPIDRRALVEHGELDLTEKRIRSAIRTLEEVGFLDRAVASGSGYKATEDGLRRKPVLFMFGAEYAPAFIAANKRAAAARGGHPGERRPIPAKPARRAPAPCFEASPLKGPKGIAVVEKTVPMGPLVNKSGLPPSASEPNPGLEAALDRLLQGIRQSRGG